MKRLILAVVAVLIVCALLSSCSGGNKTADGVIYSMRFLSDNMVYYNVNGGHIMFSVLEDADESYYACADPLCNHNDTRCPAYAHIIQYTLIVPQKDNPFPLVYIFSRRPTSEYIDGEWIHHSNEEVNLGRTTVYNGATNESRVLAETDYSRVLGAWYLDGKIYMSVEYNHGGLGYKVGVIDSVTGEYEEVKSGEADVAGLGISGDRFYYITDRGNVYSCDLSLGDIREEYDCGVSPKRQDSRTVTAYVDSGMLYFERNCRIPEKMQGDEMATFFMISDVYAVRLDNIEAGETLVAEGVRQFKPYGGDLYYTVWDYDDFGIYACDDNCVRNIISSDGGTLYRYDQMSSESSACVTDIGTDFYEFYDVTDEYVLFEGLQYDDVENYNTEDAYNMKYFFNYICVCNIKTGEWHVVCHTYSDPDEYGRALWSVS